MRAWVCLMSEQAEKQTHVPAVARLARHAPHAHTERVTATAQCLETGHPNTRRPSRSHNECTQVCKLHAVRAAREQLGPFEVIRGEMPCFQSLNGQKFRVAVPNSSLRSHLAYMLFSDRLIAAASYLS
jgi:hypothetical protein